jgi:rubrerythrin
MMRNKSLLILALALLFSLILASQTALAAPEEGDTYNNLYASVQGETNASAAYRAFAAKALAEGYPVIARLFEATAEAEAKHADDEWAILVSMGATSRPVAGAPTVGTTAQNLQAAFNGETYEYTVMYPGFLAAAQAEGNTAAARIFNLAMRAEEIHAGNYADVLVLLRADNVSTINAKYAVIYRCVVCGEVVTTRPDPRCPICGAAGDTFVKYGGTYSLTYSLTPANPAILAFEPPYHIHGTPPALVADIPDGFTVKVAGRCDEPQFGLHLVGYRFIGWTEDNNWSAGSTATVYREGDDFRINGADVVLYSVWGVDEPAGTVKYRVIYKLNGGAGTAPADQGPFLNFFHFTPAEYDKDLFYYPGHTFLGWSVDQNAVAPDPRHPNGTLAIENQSDMTLYAVWEKAGATYDNLYASVQGETSASAAYKAFAVKAREEGYPVIALLFEATAEAEAKHAEDEWAILVSMGATVRPVAGAPTVGTTIQNLQAAFNGETYEYTVMYPGFLAAAQAEGNAEAARIFRLAMRAEEIHAGNYADVLALLLANNVSTINAKYAVVYRCVVCGEVVTKLPDPRCPICGAASDTFVRYAGTYANLYASVQGETNASAAYKAFAAKAREEGYPVIALLFEATADAETKHADDEWAILVSMGATNRPTAGAPTVGTTAQNLQAAFDGETYEYTVMYPEFLATAQAEGNTAAARIFNLAMRAEEVHAGNYADVAALLQAGKVAEINAKYSVVYRCVVCGEVVTTRPDPRCPICGAAGDTFVKYGGGLTVNFPGIKGVTVQYWTNTWTTIEGTFDDTCTFPLPEGAAITTVQVVKGGMSHTFNGLNAINVLNVPIETITVGGITATCDLAIVQNDWVYPYAAAAVDVVNEFKVFDNGKKYEVRLFRPGFYPIIIPGIDAGQTVSFGPSYIYEATVPAGVTNVWISSNDWAVRGANAGDKIALLCDAFGTIREAKMRYDYGGKTFNIDFKLDGTNPFDLIVH